MNVRTLGKPLARRFPVLKISKLIQGKNLINAKTVGNLSTVSQPSEYTGEFTQARNLMDVMNVGKPPIGSGP